MPIENADFINDLVSTGPSSTERRHTQDDHMRLIKKVIKQSFSEVSSTVSTSASEFNKLVGLTANAQPQLNTMFETFADFTSGASTAVNAVLWEGATKYLSTATATGGSNKDLWFQFEN